MKWLAIILILFSLTFCTPKGPQSYNSPFIGKTKQELIAKKGIAKEIKIYDTSEVYIYKSKEEYYGKKASLEENAKPKKTFQIEYIYYINQKGIVYKYQVWKKKI